MSQSTTTAGDPAYDGLHLPKAGNLITLSTAGIAATGSSGAMTEAVLQACLCGLDLVESVRHTKDLEAEITLIREGLCLISRALPKGAPASRAETKKEKAFAAYDHYFDVSRTEEHEIEGLVVALLQVYLRWLLDLREGHSLSPTETALLRQGFRTMATDIKRTIKVDRK